MPMGEALSHSQWSRLNRFALKLHADISREHFFHCCLEELPGVLDLLCVAWNDFDEHFQIVSNRETAALSQQVGSYLPAMIETMNSHPVVEFVEEELRGERFEGVMAMTDRVSSRQLRERAIHYEAYRHLGIQDQMYTELQFTHQHRSGLTLNAGKPFTAEQKQMAAVVREHLLVAYRNVLRSEQAPPVFGSEDRRHILQTSLSPRLQETLGHLLNGLPRKLISDEMGISIHTLNDYVREVYSRLGVHSHAELIAKFDQQKSAR